MALVPISMLSKINDSIAAALKRKLDANGVRNDATTTDAGYVLDARMGKTLGDRAEKLELKVGDLYFDTDSSGRWGYKSSKNGAVTPFRNPTGSAAAADVLSGKTFSSATAENAAGSMPNNGAWTGKTTGKGNVTIPAGYHSGQGYVSGDGAYNAGMSDADARVNENSASYKSGYANGANAKSMIYLGSAQSFNVVAACQGRGIDYHALTLDNFIITVAEYNTDYNARPNTWFNLSSNEGESKGFVQGTANLRASYNASSGVLTTNMEVRQLLHIGENDDQTQNHNVRAWLVP